MNVEEMHTRHTCVDETAASIIKAANRIEELWEKYRLPCQFVKNEGLREIDTAIWELVDTMEDYCQEVES